MSVQYGMARALWCDYISASARLYPIGFATASVTNTPAGVICATTVIRTMTALSPFNAVSMVSKFGK
jgi:hypothetical protein